MADSDKQARAAQWRETLKDIAREKGFFEEVGPAHKAIYIPQEGPAGKTLVVAFDNLDDVRQSSDRLPWAVDFISSQGWSSLGFMAHGMTWYRDDHVHDFFDRMQAERFFDQFERVVFYGTSMGGYAASVFSSAAPGSTVVAINPQATLSRERAGWERRFRPAWRNDWTGRYGYAPDMVRDAEKVWLFYDSSNAPDSMHVALYRGENIEKVACPFMGHGMLTVWRDMGVLKPVVSGCINGTASRLEIARLMRARHLSGAYQKMLLKHLEQTGDHAKIARLCRFVISKRHAPHFRNALARAEEALAR
ncbi:MAG: hypothetical protein CSA72_10670 [Rhodobacterales bacterium]|nr:MAG: hypothetical protein CSA72_10670 [Rhodobacterales bacterium]